MPRRKGVAKKVGYYHSKRRKVDGTHVYKGQKSGLFMKPRAGARKRKRYIAKKYRKNVRYD